VSPEEFSGRLEKWHPTCPSDSWRGIMHSFDLGVFEQQDVVVRPKRKKIESPLRALAATFLTLAASVPSAFAQQAPTATANKAASDLPPAPVPTQTEPLFLRQSARDFSNPAGHLLSNPINIYRPTTIAKADFNNSIRLQGIGEGWQDLPEPVRCDCACPREQLRHRHRSLLPRHCRYRPVARQRREQACAA
jgi:hypothetical protein